LRVLLTPARLLSGFWLMTLRGLQGDLAAESFVDAFAGDGMPVGDTRVFTSETDPNQLLGRPGQYFAKATWSDECVSPRSAGEAPVSVSSGGSIELFRSSDDRELRQEYLYGFIELVMIDEYSFGRGNLIARFTRLPAR
jgi:hypothetical protein